MSMNTLLSSLVTQVYSPPSLKSGSFDIEKWLGTSAIRYYSYGRHAMASALRLSGVGPGDKVALPEFICRDLLSSVASVGASVLFYPVDDALNLAWPTSRLEEAKVIVAVNYFGFPQDLIFFSEISKQTGAILIEDNAHGFLSRDTDGTPLGCRAPLAVFSFRKTLPIANGAALVANDSLIAAQLPDQLPFADENPGAGFLFKRCLRNLVPYTGISPCRSATSATRLLRKVLTGHAISPSDPDNEARLPLPAAPCKEFRSQMERTNAVAEISRRRDLYLILHDEISRCGGEPVFDGLPEGIAPYAFPFRSEASSLGRIRCYMAQAGLECHLWPDLPDAAIRSGKAHYSNVWIAPLLW